MWTASVARRRSVTSAVSTPLTAGKAGLPVNLVTISACLIARLMSEWSLLPFSTSRLGSYRLALAQPSKPEAERRTESGGYIEDQAG